MITADELLAWREGHRGDWSLHDPLTALDPQSSPPSAPVPAGFGADVAATVAVLATHWPQSAVMRGVRTLERLGVVTLEHDDTYILALVSALGDRHEPKPRLDAVRGDAELRDTLLWRVFEVEGGGEISLANVDKYSNPEAGWAQLFHDVPAVHTSGPHDQSRLSAAPAANPRS